MFRAIMQLPEKTRIPISNGGSRRGSQPGHSYTKPKQSIMMGPRYFFPAMTSSCSMKLAASKISAPIFGKPDIMHRRGFFAAHWLGIASTQLRTSRNSARRKGGRLMSSRTCCRNCLNIGAHTSIHFEADRRAYAAAAHLWLANFDERNEGLRLTPQATARLDGFQSLEHV